MRFASILLLPAVMPAALANAALGANSTASSGKRASNIDCQGVQACGVLTLESGFGPVGTPYNHPNFTAVHGLWPQVAPYGNSQCIAPGSTANPTKVYPCYAIKGQASAQLTFEEHEWGKHGVCAGVQDVDDFFTQICSLAVAPLSIMSGLPTMDAMQSALTSKGFDILSVDTTDMQIEVGVCRDDTTHQWKFSSADQFWNNCGSGGPTPPPSPPTPPAGGSCLPNQHGPVCTTNDECTRYTGCIRCASSGFCTSDPALEISR